MGPPNVASTCWQVDARIMTIHESTKLNSIPYYIAQPHMNILMRLCYFVAEESGPQDKQFNVYNKL